MPEPKPDIHTVYPPQSFQTKMSVVKRTFIWLLIAIVLSSAGQAQLYGPNRAQTISNIFQIPIQTLTAISNVVQNTRPVGEVFQQRIMRIQQLQQYIGSSNYAQAAYYNQFRPDQFPSRASQVAGLQTAADGSGFRI